MSWRAHWVILAGDTALVVVRAPWVERRSTNVRARASVRPVLSQCHFMLNSPSQMYSGVVRAHTSAAGSLLGKGWNQPNVRACTCPAQVHEKDLFLQACARARCTHKRHRLHTHTDAHNTHTRTAQHHHRLAPHTGSRWRRANVDRGQFSACLQVTLCGRPSPQLCSSALVLRNTTLAIGEAHAQQVLRQRVTLVCSK